jgi:hypothetical protein
MLLNLIFFFFFRFNMVKYLKILEDLGSELDTINKLNKY